MSQISTRRTAGVGAWYRRLAAGAGCRQGTTPADGRRADPAGADAAAAEPDRRRIALTDALKALNARLDDQANATRKAIADQKLIIDNLASDLRIVREKVDDNNVRIASLSQEVDAMRQAVQAAARRGYAARVGGDAGHRRRHAADGRLRRRRRRRPAPSAPLRRVCTIARSGRLHAGQWDLAIQGFESYIKIVSEIRPGRRRQVLIGNSYLQAGKNDKAVEAYDQAIRTYPGGDAIPEAYYKKGLALRNLKQLDQARAGVRATSSRTIQTPADSSRASD